jgi:dTDP-4-amino-4,6-dideoxygalactose transaminase
MRELFAKYFNKNEENIFLFSKGRVGLYAALKALGLSKGDEIIMPGYTCMVVPSAARFLGLECKYVDIDPETYNIDLREINSVLNEKTRAIIVQHTYGIPLKMDSFLEISGNKNISLIEDCCHSFGSRYKAQLCGTFGAASFFSGQWNKPFSTGLGGILMVNDNKLLPDIENIFNKADTSSFIENLRLKLQIMAYNRFVTPGTNYMITKIYRQLSRIGIMTGSSSNEELKGKMPPQYLKKMSPCQMFEGRKNLLIIKNVIDARKKNTEIYAKELEKIGFEPLKLSSDRESVILRYPLRVANKDELLDLAFKMHFEIGSWFEIPLHPKGTDMTALGYQNGMCPVAEKASREVINLPTHQKISEREIYRIINFLKKYALPVE